MNTPSARAPSPALSKWALLAMVSALVLVADQATKYLAVERLTVLFQTTNARTFPERAAAFVHERDLLERGLASPVPTDIVRPVWQHRYTQNRGAAWGLLSGVADRVRVPLFFLITLGAVAFIAFSMRGLQTRQRFQQVALALVLGGALGNAIDRALRGYVIDFIDWYWFDPNWLQPNLHWPTFNVADAGISVGLLCLLIESFRHARHKAH